MLINDFLYSARAAVCQVQGSGFRLLLNCTLNPDPQPKPNRIEIQIFRLLKGEGTLNPEP